MSWNGKDIKNKYIFKNISKGQTVSKERINKIDKLAPESLRNSNMGDIETLLALQTEYE